MNEWIWKFQNPSFVSKWDVIKTSKWGFSHVLKNLKLIHFYIYEYFCLNVYMCTMCIPGAYGSQKRSLDSLGLEWWRVVSHRVGAGSWPGSSARVTQFLNHWAISMPLHPFYTRKGHLKDRTVRCKIAHGSWQRRSMSSFSPQVSYGHLSVWVPQALTTVFDRMVPESVLNFWILSTQNASPSPLPIHSKIPHGFGGKLKCKD